MKKKFSRSKVIENLTTFGKDREMQDNNFIKYFNTVFFESCQFFKRKKL